MSAARLSDTEKAILEASTPMLESSAFQASIVWARGVVVWIGDWGVCGDVVSKLVVVTRHMIQQASINER